MSMDKKLAELIAKDEIRELVLQYSRGVDRKDGPLLRTLYAKGAEDHHDISFTGDAEAYIDFLEQSFPYMPYSGHHVCNHMISVDVDAGEGEGEVYAIAYHAIPDGQGGMKEDFMCVRYIDRYCVEDGRWMFAKRVVHYDYRSEHPIDGMHRPMPDPDQDPSVTELSHRLFQRGARA